MAQLKNKFKPVLSDSKIQWLPRYSSDMNDDDMGRWARVAYAGKLEGVSFCRGKVCRWEIAWIKKCPVPKTKKIKFVVNPQYPYTGKYSFDTLEDAQNEVEVTFRWFIKKCVGKIHLRKNK